MKNFEWNLCASFFVFWTAIVAAKVSPNSQQTSPTGIHSIRNRSYGTVFERTQYSGATRRMASTQRWCKPDCYKVRILLGALMLLWGIICLVFPIRHIHNDNFFRGKGLSRFPIRTKSSKNQAARKKSDTVPSVKNEYRGCVSMSHCVSTW